MEVLSLFCVVKLQGLRFLQHQCRSCVSASVCSVAHREKRNALLFVTGSGFREGVPIIFLYRYFNPLPYQSGW